MADFDRYEAIKQLPAETIQKITRFERGLKDNIKAAGLQSEEADLVRKIMDFRVCYNCSEFYRKKYNALAKELNKKAKESYDGLSYAEARKKADEYSRKCHILANYEYCYEQYDRVATQLAPEAEKANARIEERLYQKGYRDDQGRSPRKK